MLELLEKSSVPWCLALSDPPSGLRALLIIDDTSLGPAAGGVRTRSYPSEAAAFEDVAALARAMTIKCAIAGLDAGGGKAVVFDHPGLDRPRAFQVLGEKIEELGGLFRTAGDFGTRAEDLEAMARATRYVHTREDSLGGAVARGVLRCVEALVELKQRRGGLDGLRVAVQGCGAMGRRVAELLSAHGASLFVSDLDPAKAAEVAERIGAVVVAPEDILSLEVDILSPCAVGGVIDASVVGRLRAWAVCGAANNILSDASTAGELAARGIWFVPDFISSAGAVVEGIGESVMGLSDRSPLVDGLGARAKRVLSEALQTGRSTVEVGLEQARARIEEARSKRR